MMHATFNSLISRNATTHAHAHAHTHAHAHAHALWWWRRRWWCRDPWARLCSGFRSKFHGVCKMNLTCFREGYMKSMYVGPFELLFEMPSHISRSLYQSINLMYMQPSFPLSLSLSLPILCICFALFFFFQK